MSLLDHFIWSMYGVYMLFFMLNECLTPEGTANPWYWDFQFVGLL